MDRKKCSRCGSWMFELAVVCPHCGADQSALDPLMQGLDEVEPTRPVAPPDRSPVSLSREEAGSLAKLATAASPSDSPSNERGGVIVWMILPQTSGARRPWEITLTVLAMPLILITLTTLGWWAFRFRIGIGRVEAWLAAPLSAAVVFCLLMAERTALWAAILIPGVMLAAWLLRGLLRRHKNPLL